MFCRFYTNKMVRKISIGAVLFLLLTVNILMWGPLSDFAVAKSGMTLGFAVDGSGLVSSSDLSKELGAYLEEQLSAPVKVRNFTTEEHLYAWLTRYFEVDAAWISKDFLQDVPGGGLYQLARNLDHFPGIYQGSFVARQGLSRGQSERLVKVLMDMHENEAGRELLAKLEISRFVSSLRWQTSDWEPPEAIQPSETVAMPHSEESPLSEPKQTSVAVEITKAPKEELVPEVEPLPLAAETSSAEQGAKLPEPVPATLTAVKTDPKLAEVAAAPEVDQEDEKAGAEPLPVVVKDEAPIALVADYLAYNSADDSYEAKGDVVLQQAGVELKSDSLLWQAATQDAAAHGAVHLKDADTELSGETLQYNMSTGQGQIREGKVFVHDGNFHLAGEQVEKRGQADYFVKDGSFTTCDGEIPDWKFTASEVEVTLGGYAEAKNVWFHVKDVPVLYTPYLLFPVKTERESGLLAPMFGYSESKGVRTSLAWYQVIDRHLDATFYLDYLSEIGLGKGVEYRYALAAQNNGEALYYHVTGLKDNPDLYYLDWKHSGNLPADWRFLADIEYTNDQLFFEEFGESADQYNRDETVSTVMLQRSWQKLNLVGYARYLQDLDNSNDDTLQRLPEVGVGLARYRLGDAPLYVGLESYATRFSRREGEEGERLFLRPSLAATFKPGSWLELTPEVAFYERLYNVDDADEEGSIPEFSLTAATRLVRTFDLNRWGVDRLQHSIEPKASYRYVTRENQDKLPLFDVFDRIGERNQVSYSLVNRLTTRSTAEDGSKVYRELFNLRLSQSYNIDEARNNTSGEDQPFSDVRVEMDLRPSAYVSLTADGLVPVYGDNQFNSLSVGATVSDEPGNLVNASYTYRDAEYAGVGTDYLRLRVSTPLLKPLYVKAEERYDFRNNRELEKVVGLEYRSKCWSLLLSYRNRYRADEEDDHEFSIMFVLSGLGATPGLGGGLGGLGR